MLEIFLNSEIETPKGVGEELTMLKDQGTVHNKCMCVLCVSLSQAFT